LRSPQRQIAKQSAALVAAGLPPTPVPTHHQRPQRGYRSVGGLHVSDLPEYALEWHPTKNEELQASDVRAASSQEVWWLCAKGHEWPRRVAARTTLGSQCPFCTNRRVDASNSLASLGPDLAAEWDTERNSFGPDTVTLGADRYAWWICKTCGNRWKSRILVRGKQGGGCAEWESMPHPGGPVRHKPRPKKTRHMKADEPAPEPPAWTQPEGYLFAEDPPALDPPEAIAEDPDFPFD
jgi:hypothetical protein